MPSESSTINPNLCLFDGPFRGSIGMGWPKTMEDICDRYCEGSSLGGPPVQLVQSRDWIERGHSMLQDFIDYYHLEKQPLDQISTEGWAGHFNNVKTLHNILIPVKDLLEQHPESWNVVMAIEDSLRRFFQDVQIHGPLSKSVFQNVYVRSQNIHTRCKNVHRKLDQFRKEVREEAAKEIRESLKQFDEVRDKYDRDFKELERYESLVNETKGYWDHFVQLGTVLKVQRQYRPILQNIDRFDLNKIQEKFVGLDHKGGYRLQGASGSGKTLILIHRAARLARENPTRRVRLFTINRVLANLLQSSLEAIPGNKPKNLEVEAFYDFLKKSVSHFEPGETLRLVDHRSGEQMEISWADFYRKLGDQNARQCPIKRELSKQTILKFIRKIRTHENGKLDDRRYLREEMVYIQSAYKIPDREQYLTDHRQSRSVVFTKSQKEICLKILQAWEEWLAVGDLCDIDGLPPRAAKYFENPTHLTKIRQLFSTDFVLVDEVQDFSTLEMQLLRKLVADPEKLNCFFLVGDLNQKIYPKHHNSRKGGFDFRGRADILRQNFRNTRQILKAALNLPVTFPPKEDDEGTEIMNPDLSEYNGGRPVVLECKTETHLRVVLDVVQIRSSNRVAVISENVHFLNDLKREAERLGFFCHELLRNEDLDKWRDQGDTLSANLVVSRLEAVKGFEFDTVIACDLSLGKYPRVGTPDGELWRQSAVLYAALTRARDELIITYVGKPSGFVERMLADVELHKAIDDTKVKQIFSI